MRSELTKGIVILFTLLGPLQTVSAEDLTSTEVNGLPLGIQSALRLQITTDVRTHVYSEAQAEAWRKVAQTREIAELQTRLRKAYQEKDDVNRQRSALRVEYWSELSRHNILQRWWEYHNKWVWSGNYEARDRSFLQEAESKQKSIESLQTQLDQLRKPGTDVTLDPQADTTVWQVAIQAPIQCAEGETALHFKPWREDGHELLPFGGRDREAEHFDFYACANAQNLATKLWASDRRQPATAFVSAFEIDSKEQVRTIVISHVAKGTGVPVEKRVRAGASWALVPVDRVSAL